MLCFGRELPSICPDISACVSLAPLLSLLLFALHSSLFLSHCWVIRRDMTTPSVKIKKHTAAHRVVPCAAALKGHCSCDAAVAQAPDTEYDTTINFLGCKLGC